MPYKSEAQRRYFNANREKLEAQGVDVDHWNDVSRGKKLPERKTEKSAIAVLAKAAAESEMEFQPPSSINRVISLLGNVGLGGLSQIANTAYSNRVIGGADHFNAKPPTRGKPLQGQHLPIQSDISALPKGFPYSASRTKSYQALAKLYGSDVPTIRPQTAAVTPAGYLPRDHSVFMHPSIKDEAGHVLAHELGHARQRRFLKSPLGVSSMLLPRIGSLGGLLGVLGSDDETTGRNAALFGSASYLPLLGLEADASLRGSNLMKRLAQQSGKYSQMGMLDKLKYRLGSFKGFPTYLNAAAFPLLGHGLKKTLKGYGKYVPKNVEPGFKEKLQALLDKVRNK